MHFISSAYPDVELFFELSQDLLCILGSDGFFKRLNPAWSRLLGWSVEEMLTAPYLEFVHPDDTTSTLQAAQTLVGSAELSSFDNRYRCKDGSYRWIRWNATGVLESQLIYATAHDVTEIRRAQDLVQNLNTELEQRVTHRTTQLQAAVQELEAFCYSVSHDLRAPLRSMDGFSRILLEDFAPELPAPVQHYLTRIRHNAQTMGNLIDDLLAFSRLNRQLVNKKWIQTQALVRQTLEELEAETQQREMRIQVAQLPNCYADASLLHQVFMNLLSNAIKFTRHRTPAIIDVGAYQEGDDIVYFVKDNGVGFDMQYQNKLFGVFQRLHRSEDFEGTGVGLALVQRIVHRHGGRVWAAGELNQGATFFFALHAGEGEANERSEN